MQRPRFPVTSEDATIISRRCEELVYRAAKYTDQRSWEELASLFAEEGKLIRPSDPANPIVGRDRILPVPRRLAGARVGRQGRRYILGLGSYPCQAIEGGHESGILGERSADRRHWRSFDFLEQHNERSASS